MRRSRGGSPPHHSMLGRLFSQLGLAILSAFLALILWVMVTDAQAPVREEIVSARLEAEQIPSNYVVSNITPDQISVRLTGTSAALAKVNVRLDLEARVDISASEERDESQQEVVVEGKVRLNVRGSSKVTAESLTTTASVTLERQERREFQVQVKSSGSPQFGYSPETITPSVADATVTGTRRNVSAVEAVVADVKLDNLGVSVTQKVTLEARDRNGRSISGVQIEPQTVDVSIKMRQEILSKEVVVYIPTRGRPKAGYNLTTVRAEPLTVQVSGPLELVNALAAISTQEIDIEGADQDFRRSVRVTVPQGLTVPAQQQMVIASVSIQAVRVTGWTVPVVPRVVNVSPGLSAQLAAPGLALIVSGPVADILQIRANDLSVILDAAGLGAGTHRLEPRVAGLPATVQLESVVPERIEVQLTPAR